MILVACIVALAMSKPPSADELTHSYYDDLRKACHDDDHCCLSSVNAMEAAKGYRTKGFSKDCKAEDGYQFEMLRCYTSLRWCEPIKKTTPAQ